MIRRARRLKILYKAVKERGFLSIKDGMQILGSLDATYDVVRKDLIQLAGMHRNELCYYRGVLYLRELMEKETTEE